MDTTSARLLDEFARQRGADAMRPDDWKRFYDFIVDAFERDVPIRSDEIRSRLTAGRLPEQEALELAAFYDRARDLLEHHDDRVI